MAREEDEIQLNKGQSFQRWTLSHCGLLIYQLGLEGQRLKDVVCRNAARVWKINGWQEGQNVLL